MGKKGKKKPQSQGEQPPTPAQGSQPGPSRETSEPPGDQPTKGKKGQPQEQRQQAEGKGPRPEHPPQQQKGTSAPQQGQGRQQESAQPPQQERQGQQQTQAWTQQRGGQPPGQAQQQQGGHPPGQSQHQRGGQPPGQAQQPRGGQPQQQRGDQPQQQRGGQPQQQRGGQPQQQRGGQPQQQRGGQSQQQRGGQPQQQRGGQPEQQRGGQPWQQPAQPQQQRGGQPVEPQQQRGGQPPGQLQPPQQQRGPTWATQQAGAPPHQQQQTGRQPQQTSPPGRYPDQGQQRPTDQQARGPPQGYQAGPPGYQVGGAQGPPQVSPPGQGQESARGGPPQRAAGKGQPQRQQPQPTQGQQPSRSSSQSSVPSVGSVTSGITDIAIRRDAGDAGIVSQTRRLPGRKGRVIKVESNHLQLNLGSLKLAYHYDVNIVPDKPKKYMRPVVDSFRRKRFPKRWPAFDGKKNLYVSSPLTDNLNDFFEEDVVITEDDGRSKTFKVEIKFANKVDMTPLHNLLVSPVTPQEAIQVVDIVLRMAPVVSCFPVGRSFFVKPDRIIDLGQGMEMYHGFYQSAIRGWKPLLNVDVAHKAFPKDINVVDALVDLLNTGRQEFRREDLRSLDRFQEETLFNYIKTLRVNYEIPGHPGSRKGYRVNGLGDNAQTATFMHENRQTNIVDYFSRFKNYRLKYPSLPTLWVGNPQRPDKILLPLELCCICEGQALTRKMTDLQTSKMIRQAATDTATRKGKIMQGINRSNYNENPCVKEFGFSVGNEFQKLDARVLTPPELQYANNRTVRVNKGVWRNESFLNGVTINKWTIVNVCRYPPRPDEYRKMIDLFERSARDCGMVFASRVTEPFTNIAGRQAYHDIEPYFKSQKGKFDVIFVVVPESGPQYSYVKKAAEIAVGCLTQCIKSNTVGRKMNPQTAVNILLKVNSKLNGINHTFSQNTKPPILKRPIMIMGADVTHPGPDSRDIPSVAAVTASHDPKAFQYNICWRLQNPKVEIIEDLEAIVQEHLKFFYQKTKVKPEAIVFFRDGVSEGQFDQVKNAEIRAIRLACKKMQAEGYEPKITFLVVQKRHHTRLFPLNPRDSEDRNQNVPAGTCVDTDITHPFLQDFYLVSHASIQGVAKPTKYCTLWDDNNMDNDQVEELAYYLCHMFSRCNRSVSYPAPTYYAHLAAARAKVYIENDRLNMDRLRQEFEKFQIRDEIRKDLPMFFV